MKAFARKIVKDHKDMTQSLDRFVSDRKLAIVAGTEKETQAEVDRLGRLEGSAFDKAYIQRIIDDHDKTVQMFEAPTKYGKDAKLSAFAKEMLPITQEHLREARALASEPK